MDDRLYRWLSGTTCHGHGHPVNEYHDGRFWLLKHEGHSSWCGWSSGNQWCGVWYGLYDMEHFDDSDFAYGFDGFSQKWEGRWSKKKEAEMHEIMTKILKREK